MILACKIKSVLLQSNLYAIPHVMFRKAGSAFIFILMLAAGYVPALNAQTRTIDSLLHLLKTQSADTNKIKTLNELAWEFSITGSYDSSLLFAHQALDEGNKLSFKTGIAVTYSYIGNVYYYQGNYPAAIQNYEASLKMRKEAGDKKGMATTYSNIGSVYYNLGNYPEALKNYLAALKIGEQANDKKGIAYTYNNIGVVYFDQGNYEEALKNYLPALKIFEEISDKTAIASSYGNLGNVYSNQGNYGEALKSYIAALKIFEETGDKKGIALSYNNIAIIYATRGNEAEAAGDSKTSEAERSEALRNHLISLKIRGEIGDNNGSAMSYNNIGLLKIKLRQFGSAKEYLDKGLALSKEIGAKEWIRESHQYLSLLDSLTGNYKSALENYKLYILYHDSLNNEENTKKTVQQQMQYEFDKKESLTKAEQEKKDLKSDEEKRQQRIVLWFTVFGLGLVIVIAVFIFRSLQINKRKNKIITRQTEMVEKQKQIVEEKQKEILSSIYYARRIQRALITNEKYIERNLNKMNRH